MSSSQSLLHRALASVRDGVGAAAAISVVGGGIAQNLGAYRTEHRVFSAPFCPVYEIGVFLHHRMLMNNQAQVLGHKGDKGVAVYKCALLEGRT